MTGIFDTHAHYADSAFDEDREQVLEELPRKGVKLVMLAGSSLEDSAANVELAKRYGYNYAAAGVHPESVDETPADYIDRLKSLIASHPKVKAVGEIGLDYHYDNYEYARHSSQPQCCRGHCGYTEGVLSPRRGTLLQRLSRDRKGDTEDRYVHRLYGSPHIQERKESTESSG